MTTPLEAENQRLIAFIKKADHHKHCKSWNGNRLKGLEGQVEMYCDCWKKEALSNPADKDEAMASTKKANYVGAPAIFLLEVACREINDAFNGFGCYQVGSSLARPDWRDVDVRYIMDDEEFKKLFPKANFTHFQHDTRWLLLTTSISGHLSKFTGLPIDFQIQPQSHANEKHPGKRHALGLVFEGVD